MKTYFNHLDIHTNHIFDFETECFLRDPLEFDKTQTRKILSQLIRKLTPQRGHKKSIKDDPCPLLQNYLVTQESPEFDYWFALKLRQYQMNLKRICEFLNYHLCKSFDNDKELYNEFLMILLLQYGKIFFKKKVSKITKQYQSTFLLPIKNKCQNTKVRNPKTNYHTLLLKSFENNPSYIKNNIVHYMDVLSRLKKENFIDKQTSFEQFKAILRNQRLDSIYRIKWIGSNKELQWFVKHLVYDVKKVVDLDKDIWLVTMKCFTKKDGEEFTESQLRNATGNKLYRKKSLEAILSKI